MRKLLWPISLLTLALGAAAAAAEDLTLSLRELSFNQEERTCQASFYLQSLDGDLPAGFALDYQAFHEEVELQRCRYIDMAEEDPEWSCTHSMLTQCSGIGKVRVTEVTCLDDSEQAVACGGSIGMAEEAYLVDGRKTKKN